MPFFTGEIFRFFGGILLTLTPFGSMLSITEMGSLFMSFLLLVSGLLRITQVNINKQTSKHMLSMESYLHFGLYFDLLSIVVCFLFLCFRGFHGLNALLLVCSLLSAVFLFSELIVSMSAMKTAPLVLCTICSMGGSIILPTVVSIFLFNEPMSLPKWLGVAVFFTAVYFLSPAGKKTTCVFTWRTALLLTVSFFMNGFAGILGKYYAMHAVNGNEAMFTLFIYIFSASIYGIAFPLYLRKKASVSGQPGFQFLPKGLYLLGILQGVVCCILMCLNTLLAKTVPAVILSSVPSAISIVGCLLTGFFFYGEKITWKNALGMLCGIASILLIV